MRATGSALIVAAFLTALLVPNSILAGKAVPTLEGVFDQSRKTAVPDLIPPIRPPFQVQDITRKLSSPWYFAPWAAGLALRDVRAVSQQPTLSFFCGATLIDPEWALTAAYCVVDTTASDIELRYGANEFGLARRAEIKRIFLHPDYNRGDFRKNSNNIALLVLAGVDVKSAHGLPRIPYQPFDFSIYSSDARVVGWGSVSETGPVSSSLIQIDTTIIERDLCNSPTWYAGKVQADSLCAVSKLHGVDTFQGFDGSGLISQTKSAPQLIGVVSWGEGCGLPNKPTVYTNVSSSYLAGWIRDTIRKRQ